MNYYQELIKLYDNSWRTGTVAPIAHTMVRAKIGVLLSENGQLLAANKIDEAMPIPCTLRSETRTSNIAPHAIHDNITYLSDTPEKQNRHIAYMEQLRSYLSAWEDPLAIAAYRYLSKGDNQNGFSPHSQKYSAFRRGLHRFFAAQNGKLHFRNLDRLVYTLPSKKWNVFYNRRARLYTGCVSTRNKICIRYGPFIYGGRR